VHRATVSTSATILVLGWPIGLHSTSRVNPSVRPPAALGSVKRIDSRPRRCPLGPTRVRVPVSRRGWSSVECLVAIASTRSALIVPVNVTDFSPSLPSNSSALNDVPDTTTRPLPLVIYQLLTAEMAANQLHERSSTVFRAVPPPWPH